MGRGGLGEFSLSEPPPHPTPVQDKDGPASDTLEPPQGTGARRHGSHYLLSENRFPCRRPSQISV